MARKGNHQTITSTTRDSDSDSDSSTGSILADLSSHHDHRSLPPRLPPTLSAAHHRTVVALPPPSRPLDPKCWYWRCHKCKSRYPMGATQRCLLCGHKVCRTPRPVDANHRPAAAKRNECRAFFDYTGWKNWAKWRRHLVAHNETQPRRRPPTPDLSLSAFTAINTSRSKAAKGSHKKTYQAEPVNAARRLRKERTRLVVQMNGQRLERMRTGQHDCVTDCDWPSECRYEQVLALKEETEYWEEYDGEADDEEQNEGEGEEEEDDQKDGDNEGNDDIPETSQWDLDLPSPEEAYPEHLLTGAEPTTPDSQDHNFSASPFNFQIIDDDGPPAERDSEESRIPIDPALEDWLPATLCPKQLRTPLPDSPRSPEPSDEDEEDFGKTQGNVTNESHGNVHGEEEAALIRMHREFMAGSLA